MTALLHQMGTGLLVTDVMGTRCQYRYSDYSRGASGFFGWKMVEIQYPVAEITSWQATTRYAENMVAVADDIEHRSNIQTGSIC